MNADRAEHIRRCREKIAEHGHMVAAIGGDEETGEPQYAYTIGVSTFCGVEFVISGLDVEVMHDAMNALAYKAREDKFKPTDGLLVEGVFVEPYMPKLRLVDPTRLGNFGWIPDVLDVPDMPPLWQAHYSTQDHRYPGDPGYTLAEFQFDYSQPEAV